MNFVRLFWEDQSKYYASIEQVEQYNKAYHQADKSSSEYVNIGQQLEKGQSDDD